MATEAAAPRWTRLQHADRREQILAAARRLFSERHYGALSVAEIAREAGVTPGLVHHYFGTKRGLYLEVVRSMLAVAPQPAPADLAGQDPDRALEDGVDRWLEMVRRNRGTWLAAVGAQGLGRDPEVEAIVNEAREQAVDSLIEGFRPGDAATAPAEVRAAMRAYSAFAEAASVEWIERRRLTREQIRALLLQSLSQIVNVVLPKVQRVGTRNSSNAKRRKAA